MFLFDGFSERLAKDRTPEMVPEAGKQNFRSRQMTRLRGTMALGPYLGFDLLDTFITHLDLSVNPLKQKN